jgi:hypothetical protein
LSSQFSLSLGRRQVCKVVALLVAWTLADLAGLAAPTRDEISLAVELRQHSAVAA